MTKQLQAKSFWIYKDVKDKKGKIVPACALQAYGWSRGIAPLILNPGTSWR